MTNWDRGHSEEVHEVVRSNFIIYQRPGTYDSLYLLRRLNKVVFIIIESRDSY